MAPSMFHKMVWRDQLESAENMSLNGSDESGTTETSRPSTVNRVIMISVLLLGAIIWGPKSVMDTVVGVITYMSLVFGMLKLIEIITTRLNQ
jgi:hypothetical protein